MGGAGGVKTRLVKIGASNAGHAPHNRLVTAKFTLLNFLPLALFAQFRRVANLYFLLNGMLMMFAEVTGAFNSPYTSYTTLGPLMFLITISLINDALTDIQRHRADMRMDATAVDVVSRGGGQLRLANIRSGDVLRCFRGEAAPADFVMLAGSGEASTAYIDTASIDGETSLKLRRAAPLGLATRRATGGRALAGPRVGGGQGVLRLGLCTFFILYCFFIPMSLYVTFDFAKIAQMQFIDWDEEMTNEVDGQTVRAKARSLCVTDLGQVEPGEDAAEAPVYQAESPDEGALVAGGALCGYTLEARTQKTLTGVVSPPRDRQGAARTARTWDVLATNEFDNDRKRMSIVLREPGGGDVMDAYAKTGLRTLVYSAQAWSEARFSAWYETHYAPAARSLVGREEQLRGAHEAEKDLVLVGATAIEDRLQDGVPETIALMAAADIKLWVLTGDKRETAIEIARSCRLITDTMAVDVLSGDEAPDALTATLCRLYARVPGGGGGERRDDGPLARLGRATGGLRSALFPPGDRDADRDPDAVERAVSALLAKHGFAGGAGVESRRARGRVGLVLDGGAVTELFSAGYCVEVMLFRLLATYKAVLACRVTPKQKAQFVLLVQTHVPGKPVTLAIGDGANDVNMIMQAQVGVGISGLEGRQAVNASDFAIGQFRFLHRLLFIHGRWAYRRSSALILFSFYKNAVLAYCLFFYSFNTGFSGTSMFHEHYTSMYNFYLATQIFWLACFDRDVDEAYALNHPRLYDSGRLNLDLRVREVVTWQFSGLLHAVLIYYLVQESLQLGSGTSPYDTSAHMVFGTVGMVCITVAMNLKVLMETRTIVHLRP
ncbi:phospholipid-translocating ATPase [Aureococcus anophagefferens]|nr:phospholipid-translocating ATPase [Aureococcus anophagefferens]